MTTLFIPRHRKTPIDTYHFNKIFSTKYRIAQSPNGIEPPLVQKIRNFITGVVGIDPYGSIDNREGTLVIARQLFFHFIRKYVKKPDGKKWTETMAGSLLGQDHSTVNYADKCVMKYYGQERDYSEMYNKIDKAIQNGIMSN